MTTAQYVTVVMDRYDGAGNPIVRGSASWTPSMDLPDPADMMLVGQAPVPATFRAGSLPMVRLIANDSIGPQGQNSPGWTWNLSYDGVPGSPAAASYYVLTANGATQYLSALAQVPAAQPGQQYVPLPPGAVTAAELPVTTGAGAATSWVHADQMPALEHGLLGAAGITSLLAAIANRNSARVDIPVIGDSWTEGHGATAYAGIWVQQANRAIRAAYPTTANGSSGGLGFIPIQNSGTIAFTWPIAVASGSPQAIDIGPARYAQALFGTGSFTWTVPAGTSSVKIMYYCDNSFSQFSYKIGSGGATTVTVSGTVADGALTASIPITSGQVLTIAWVSGAIFLEGLIHFAGDESSGITFHACGHQGWNAGTGANGWNQAESFGINWAASYGAFSPAAVLVMLGINDANPTNGNLTGPQFQAALTALTGTTLRGETALASVPFLFAFPPAPNESYADTGGWPAYGAAIRSTAAAIAGSPQGTAVIDLNYRMPTAVSAWDGNALYDPAQGYHPTSLGHALIGEIVAAGVRIA